MEYKLLKDLIELAEDGYKLHLNNSCHSEFLREDRDIIHKAKECLNFLSGEAVKLREECSLKTQHDDMISANWKYCSECGVKL